MPALLSLSAALPHTIVLPAPAYNALNSLALLNLVDALPAVDRWVRRTATALSVAQRQANRVIFEDLGPALLVDGEAPDFPAYLALLAGQAPAALRDRVHAHYASDQGAAPLSAGGADLLADPERMQQLIVDHLRTLWNAYLQVEWARVERQLQISIGFLLAATPGSAQPPAAIVENLHTFIGGSQVYESGVSEVVFVPSAHVGPYTTRIRAASTLYLFFDAALHAQVVLRNSPVSQAELDGRLGALADPIRLRVLNLLAQQHEVALQDLMEQLDTSQPNMSRYLKAIRPFVQERRGKDGRKRYRLVPTQLDVTFQALKQSVMAATRAATPPDDGPMRAEGVARFLDRSGRLQRWPAKHGDRRDLLVYLAGHFTPGQTYGEQEVNELLQRYLVPSARDHVTARRDLIDARLLARSENGARYWRRTDDDV